MRAQQFRFQARNPHGELVSAMPASDGAARAALSLRTRLVELLNYSSGPSKKDVLDFTSQLAVMIRAGISIRTALEGIADQVTNQRFRRILLQIKADVEAGRQFSEAIARHPKLFGPLYVSMVRASEMSGSFARMLDRIAAYLAQEMETRRMVVGASIYPGIIATMAIATGTRTKPDPLVKTEVIRSKCNSSPVMNSMSLSPAMSPSSSPIVPSLTPASRSASTSPEAPPRKSPFVL